MSERLFDVTIRVNEVGSTTYTEVRHSGCPLSALLWSYAVGSVVREHIRLEPQGIKRLEVTL